MGRKPKWRHELDKADPRHDLETPAPDWVIQKHVAVQPENELEALMMTAPGEHIPEIVIKTDDTYERLDEILGVELELDDIERSVLDAVFVSGLSIRDAAEVLGTSPTTVWRVKESAMERIRKRADWATIPHEGQHVGERDAGDIIDGRDEEPETGTVRSDPADAVEEAG
jgi:DNA-directed RNA polymerase specialized sigma24 family protein